MRDGSQERARGAAEAIRQQFASAREPASEVSTISGRVPRSAVADEAGRTIAEVPATVEATERSASASRATARADLRDRATVAWSEPAHHSRAIRVASCG